VTNTATITDTGQYAEATASHCVNADLTVDVTASESLTRTFLWDINKSTTTPNLTNTTGSVVAHYGVVITALPYADSNWEIHGTATVTNPNAFTAEQVSDLAVAYSGGGTCVLDDPLPNVAASGSAPVDYHCTFASAPSSLDGQVTATVKWNADADSASDPTPAAVTEADWLAGTGTVLVNQFIKVFDNHAVPGTQDPLFAGAQLKWQDVFASTSPAAHQVAVEYDHTYTGSAMPAAGTCSNLVNTAWFTGDAAATVLGSDTATVQVCTPAVIVSPPEQQHPNVLPNTGGPALGLLAAGLVLLIGGGVLIAGDRRTRRRS
jgi:LPXTG-motif cell wall-anchored protein